MGKQPVRMKAVVYALSPFQQKVMTGLWKDVPSKIHHKISENWLSATLLLAPLIGVHMYVKNYQEKEKLSHSLWLYATEVGNQSSDFVYDKNKELQFIAKSRSVAESLNAFRKSAPELYDFIKVFFSILPREFQENGYVRDSKLAVRKALELRRLCYVQFDSSVIGVGEVCKAIICLEIAATWMGILFDRSSAIRLSGMSEKAYIRSYNLMHNSIGVKTKLDVRELAIQFGCKHKLKVDKLKLIEQCGTSESEFSSVSTSMKDLCRDTFGVAKEKKDPREVKTNRDLLDALPEKRRTEDGGYSSDERPNLSNYKKHKQMEKHDYEKCKSSVLASKDQNKAEGTDAFCAMLSLVPNLVVVFQMLKFSLAELERTKYTMGLRVKVDEVSGSVC
ncbi:hypothetical protein K1719_024388 [Acacia pycnantha]|nr:hypothetical protein K1719_024388 [Acacia pycnantha]